MRFCEIGTKRPMRRFMVGAAYSVAIVAMAAPEVMAGEPWRGEQPGYDYSPAIVVPTPPLSYLGRSRPSPASSSAPAYDNDWWSGFYLGGIAGYGMGTTRVHGDIGRFSFDQSGPLAGIVGGYNWKRGDFVVGLEAEAKATWISGSAVAAGLGLDQSTRWAGTVRGRAGVLVAPALLVYGLAGVSAADIKVSGGIAGGRSDDVFLGLQVGGGAEVKLTQQWSLRAEYTWTGYAKEQIGPPGFSNAYDPSAHALQAGLTYRF